MKNDIIPIIGRYYYFGDLSKSSSSCFIGCNIHQISWKTTLKVHKKGHGCPVCAQENSRNNKTKSYEENVSDFNLIHEPGHYTYPYFEKVNSQTKIEIVCKFHGSFWQTINNHKAGHGRSIS